MKFKVGDKVRASKIYHENMPEDNTEYGDMEIFKVTENSQFPYHTMVPDFYSNTKVEGIWDDEELDLITE